MEINIPLVNDRDEIIGFGEKLKVHQDGTLHRAFSILIFNKNGEILIHQRAFGKYHSPGLWTNTCCGHPNYGESMMNAVNRRLKEEMGIETELNFSFKFQYTANFDNGLTENEIDHVYTGYCESQFKVNPEEVAEWEWQSLPDIESEMEQNPNKFTVWFREIIQKHKHLLVSIA